MDHDTLVAVVGVVYSTVVGLAVGLAVGDVATNTPLFLFTLRSQRVKQ